MSSRQSQTAFLWLVAAGFFMQTLDTTIINTALPAIAHTLGQLTVARVLQGVGGSMLLSIGRLSLLRNMPGEQYVAALAFPSIAGQVGPIIGPTLGGWFVESASWHWIFLVNVPIGLLAVRRYMPDSSVDRVPRFDLIGCCLLPLCMAAISLAVDVPMQNHRFAWSSGLFLLSVATALAYIPHARHSREPLFRLGLFREPNFSIGLTGNLVARVGASAMPFLVPLLLPMQLGYTPIRSGLMMLPAALAGTLAKGWIVPLVGRFGYRGFLRVNTLIVRASIMAFAFVSPAAPPIVALVLLAIFGDANSMPFAAMNSATLKNFSREDAGSGNSLFSMVQMQALGLGVSIGGGLVLAFAAHRGSMQGGFEFSFICVGGITLWSALLFRRIDNAPPTRMMAATPAQ